MNILNFVLNWILNWIIFRPNSMKKWIFKTYRTGLSLIEISSDKIILVGMIAAIFTIKSWTPPFQMHLRWRVVNARKNHPSCLISPGPTQGLARYILGTRNIMYTTKLASIRHLHRHHLCHQGKNMPRWIVSGCKIAFLMSLLADFPWARSRISALQGEGCFFTHIILSARVVRLSFSILGKNYVKSWR